MSDPDQRLQEKLRRAEAAAAHSPPPLAPFGLILHHDGRWSHEGQPILNRRLRECFDRSVEYLADEAKFVVRIGRFRGQIEVQEAAFFVRSIDLDSAEVALSDLTASPLDPATLALSPIDGALLCRVKRDLAPAGLDARFSHAAQAELLDAVEDVGGGYGLRLAGSLVAFPEL
ncbi:MAG: DUF1285 domain-containing protein [Deltaproteobacteria bacterium]|nr:DUF1285 domain-containing protein [Deltaproteobacteria bacterium]MBW2383174.1 DUF1285 domain-containing protein [Deltaproteobacteria bacterium]MBW2696045.1 DUF1285 domain-containing protein [Deltaproteobacteria bacterium]